MLGVFCYAKYYMYISAYLFYAEKLHHIFKLFFFSYRRVDLGNLTGVCRLLKNELCVVCLCECSRSNILHTIKLQTTT